MSTEFIRSQVERLSLANVGEGAAAEQFEAELERIAHHIHEHVDAGESGLYATKDGCLEFTVTTKTVIRHDPERRMTDVTVSTESKLPARKAVKRAVLLRSDGFLQERDGTQLALPTRRNQSTEE